jgi:pilus assembly protein Flp/PilA
MAAMRRILIKRPMMAIRLGRDKCYGSVAIKGPDNGADQMLPILRKLARDEEGATAIEYAFIAMLIAMVIIGGATSIGTSLQGIFQSVDTGFSG